MKTIFITVEKELTDDDYERLVEYNKNGDETAILELLGLNGKIMEWEDE